MERNHLEEGNHLDRGARRSARGHLRRVRCQALPHHVVEPDQGRRRLAVRSLAGRPQGAARRERQRWAAGRRARRATRVARRTGRRRPARRPGAGGRERRQDGDTGVRRRRGYAPRRVLDGVAYYGQGRYVDNGGGASPRSRARTAQVATRRRSPVDVCDRNVTHTQARPGRKQSPSFPVAWTGARTRPKPGRLHWLDRPGRQPERLGARRRSRYERSASPAYKCRIKPDLRAVDRRLHQPRRQ